MTTYRFTVYASDSNGKPIGSKSLRAASTDKALEKAAKHFPGAYSMTAKCVAL